MDLVFLVQLQHTPCLPFVEGIFVVSDYNVDVIRLVLCTFGDVSIFQSQRVPMDGEPILI